MSRTHFVQIVLALVLPGFVLLPAWRLGGFGPNEDDVLYYLPSRTFFHDQITAGRLPLLNPWTGLDRPYLADPQSAVFYPCTWLFAILDPLTAYPVGLWLHYSLALAGMTLLLQSRGCGRWAAFFGGVAFAFSGFMLAHRAHLTLLQSAAWAPWVIWRLQRYVEAGGRRRHVVAVIACALQCFAGHVQIAALTALGSLVLLATRTTPVSLLIRRWLAAWVGAAGLFAIQALPTLAYLRECTRVHHGFFDFTENSWNPLCAIGWVFPMFFGQRTPNFFDAAYWGPSHQVEQFAYPGIATLLLALIAIRAAAPSERRSWLVLGLFGILLALGRYGPLCPVLYWIPGASVLRVPARALLLVSIAVCALAAFALDGLAGRLTPQAVRLRHAARELARRPVAAPLVLCGGLLSIFAFAWLITPDATRQAISVGIRPWNPAIWVPLVFMLVTLGVLRWAAVSWREPRRFFVLLPLLLVDLSVIGWTIDVPAGVTTRSGLLNAPRRDEWLAAVRGSGQRLWVVTSRENGTPGEYIRPLERGVANSNVLSGVAALTDYGPLQPQLFVDRFAFRPWGESERPAALLADTAWMAGCNVGWVLLCDADLPAPADCRLVLTTSGNLRLYRCDRAAGDVFLADGTRPHALHTKHDAPHDFTTTIDFSPHEATNSTQTARVIVSRLALPGWRLRVNGEPAPSIAADGLLLAVEVPATGTVTIEWRYHVPGFAFGTVVSLLTVCGLCVALMISGEQHRTGELSKRPAR